MEGDIHIINGISDILNADNIKPGIDVKELERKMLAGGFIQKVKDPQDKFNEEMKDTAKRLGVNFGESAPQKKPEPAKSQPDPFRTGSSQPKYQEPISYEEEDEEEDEQNEDDEYDNEGDEEEEPLRSPPTNYRLSESRRTDTSERYRFGSGFNGSDDLRSRTLEQERRAHINSVNAEMGAGGTGFSLDKEKKEDAKCQMLEEIDSMMYSLAEEDVDLSRIPKVDRNSSYEEVESVWKMLRHKIDRSRYCSFAEEFLLFGAYGLEELFDGQRTYFGRYRPDLTGWHNHVNVKLRRMRHDTSQLVSGIMQDYNIGPGARLLLELVPNMVLYSKMRKQQHDQPSLYSDEEIAQASNRIRDL
jgi:hypothetical protein